MLNRWNALAPDAAAAAILPCCGSTAWAAGVAAARPVETADALYELSDVVWRELPREAWLEAFASHPRIGQKHAVATAQSLAWSDGEQSAANPDELAKAALAEGNRAYEDRFQRIFIVCATGRSATEMLAILHQRMKNDPETELLEAAEQQRQITQLRLRKWLEQD
ncbi:2-oxo-4-hydroxy-4-carboxy--5-ureidoimidazoline (OHCU) decarboxylase [Granulicella sibirica]|uniref:2-oxo-4-hydroxy-4-carboxy-5-ureidoimidazoline decarboxylase n=2 Tax=Granulicella sibirica TaxID=2479048 RepID=A0A4Q0T0J1_9BACT|nr:2-oxo-4-hydroxy-4-carboxy--5-ureidoimidazoline (OHCU) decarboxylase [Granulicella sibirica]